MAAGHQPRSFMRIALFATQQPPVTLLSRRCQGGFLRGFASTIIRCEGTRNGCCPIMPSLMQSSPRHFSTNANTTAASNSSSNETTSTDENVIILYERDADRLMRPRAGMIVSTFVVTYWSWYLMDFMPHIASVGLQGNSMFGMIGLGTGVFLMAGSIFYPRLLVTKLEYVPNTRSSSPTLRVYTHHAFPIPRISRTSADLWVGQMSLDPSAHSTKRILNELKGDIGKFEGHLMVTIKTQSQNLTTLNQWLPFYLLDMSSPAEVKSGPIRLLQALLPVEKATTTRMVDAPVGEKLLNSPPPKPRKRRR